METTNNKLNQFNILTTCQVVEMNQFNILTSCKVIEMNQFNILTLCQVVEMNQFNKLTPMFTSILECFSNSLTISKWPPEQAMYNGDYK